MKYARQENKVQEFISKHQHSQFNPYLFKGELQNEFLGILKQQQDVPTGQNELTLSSSPMQHNHTVKYLIGILLLGLVMSLAAYYHFKPTGVKPASTTFDSQN